MCPPPRFAPSPWHRSPAWAGGAGERLGKDTGIIMWGSPACWRPQLPPSPGSQTLGQKQRCDPWSRVARPPHFPQKTPRCSHAAAGPWRCGPDVGDELGPPLGPAPGSARAGAEAKRRGGGEPRGVRGHEATGGVGARIGADALLEALSEQRGGSLSATDRGRREGTRLRVRVTRKVKQCGKGEVIREGGEAKTRNGRLPAPAGDAWASGAEMTTRSGHGSLRWVRRHLPGPRPLRRPQEARTPRPRVCRTQRAFTSWREIRMAGRRSRGLGVPVSFRRGRAPRVWRRRVCRQGLGPLFLRGTEKPARLARPPEILRPAAFGTGFIYSFKSASGIRSSSFSP